MLILSSVFDFPLICLNIDFLLIILCILELLLDDLCIHLHVHVAGIHSLQQIYFNQSLLAGMKMKPPVTFNIFVSILCRLSSFYPFWFNFYNCLRLILGADIT